MFCFVCIVYLIKEGGGLLKDPLELDEFVEVAIKDGLVVGEDAEFVLEVTKVVDEFADRRKVVEFLDGNGTRQEDVISSIELLQLEALLLLLLSQNKTERERPTQTQRSDFFFFCDVMWERKERTWSWK